MKLRESSILLLSDMPEVVDTLQRAIGPLVKQLLVARNTSEAASKARNAQQHAIFLCTSQSHFSLGDNFWKWCEADKAYKQVPWIVLEPHSEPPAFFKKHPQILSCKLADLEGLILTLERSLGTGPTAPELINLFILAAMEVLNAKGGVPVLRGEPFVRAAGQLPATPGGQSSHMHLDIAGRPASLLVRFPDTVLRRLKMEANELSKLIFARAVEDLKHLGVPVIAGVPQNAKPGTDDQTNRGPSICVPFDTGTGAIVVECVVPT
jgi:hypothetical protein